MKKLLSLSLVLILTACATPYQPLSFTGGFSETNLSENIFNVSFEGNGSTNKERVFDFVLLRSAEITLNNGYKHFKILNSVDDSSTSVHTTPVVANTTGYASTYGNLNTYNTYGGNSYGTYSGSTYSNSRTTISGGDSYSITKPKISHLIACFKVKPKDGISFDAESIKKSIMTKYNIQEQEVILVQEDKDLSNPKKK